MRGFTLLEILVSVGILSFLIAGIFAVLNVGDMNWHLDMGLLDLQQQARQTMNGMIRELRQSKASAITVNSTSDISFSVPPQTYGDTWIGPIRYYLDTQTQQIKREYTSATKILANNINSLNFSLSGNIMQIQLGAAKTVKQRALSFFLTEKVRLRNE